MSQNTLDLFSRIGRGVRHPWEFASNGRVRSTAIEESVDKINDAINIILRTYLGERLNVPEFGSRIEETVFQPLDEPGRDLIQIYTVEALTRWLPLIRIVNFTFMVDPDNNAIGMTIFYELVGAEQVTGSYVHPFATGGMPQSDLTTGANYGVVVR